MSRTEIIEKYWIEYLIFWKKLMAELKDLEGNQPENIMKIFTDKETMRNYAVKAEFGELGEDGFWKWYALVKLEETTK